MCASDEDSTEWLLTVWIAELTVDNAARARAGLTGGYASVVSVEDRWNGQHRRKAGHSKRGSECHQKKANPTSSPAAPEQAHAKEEGVHTATR
ncbi:hypothetical protein GCM10010275_07220 [Streptomyces litmocidini]|nr:hypothetical protein GCM10010275_07220 [Streptomyces litmocidini]